MKKNIAICSLIDFVKCILYVVGGAALLLVGALLLSNETVKENRLGDFGIAFLGTIILVIGLFGF